MWSTSIPEFTFLQVKIQTLIPNSSHLRIDHIYIPTSKDSNTDNGEWIEGYVYIYIPTSKDSNAYQY